MNDPLFAVPNMLQFETNTACNGHCTFCNYPNMQHRRTAKWSELIELMYWIAPTVKMVVPLGMQEPFLEPRLTAILANLKQQNQKIVTTVYSNMTVYDEELYKRLIFQQNLDELAISFYGTDKRTYNKLQPGFDFYQVQKNIKKFMKLRKRLGWRKPKVSMHMIVTPDTEKKCDSFVNKWRGIVDAVGFVHFDSWCGTQPYDSVYELKIWGQPETVRPPCHRLWLAVNVRSDGTLIPCCLDHNAEVDLGNAFLDHTIFNGEKIRAFRQLHLDGKQDTIDLCRDCSVWKYETPKEWKEYWRKQKLVTSVETPCTK